jgi:hypothetical protein
MIYEVLGGETRNCACGGVMDRVSETSQAVRDQCESADDTYVCRECGTYLPLDDPFESDMMEVY